MPFNQPPCSGRRVGNDMGWKVAGLREVLLANQICTYPLIIATTNTITLLCFMRLAKYKFPLAI